jgi:hypothetical protein
MLNVRHRRSLQACDYDGPSSAQHVETKPPRRWNNAGRRTPPAPQSKPVTPASRLVAQVAPLVAFELGLRILAAGPAPPSTVLLSRVAMGRLPRFLTPAHTPAMRDWERPHPRGSPAHLQPAGLCRGVGGARTDRWGGCMTWPDFSGRSLIVLAAASARGLRFGSALLRRRRA